MNRRSFVTSILGGGLIASIGKRARAGGLSPNYITDHSTPGEGTRHWRIYYGSVSAFTACTRSGAAVPAGASITAWVSVNGGAHHDAVIAGGQRFAVGNVGGVQVGSTDTIRWGATFTGMKPVALDIAIVVG